jgi:uracil-DNA glycosylase family 4
VAIHRSKMASIYNEHCRDCQRLAGFLDEVKAKHPTYFCKPVPPFGSETARVLVVGLAPGLHGANATGRPFTGDWCSDLLYGTLHKHGFAKRERSISRDDDQALIDCRLTNAVKCLPPDNKPTPLEIRTCLKYLHNEIDVLRPWVIVALGAVAHDAVIRVLSGFNSQAAESNVIRPSAHKFAHGAQHKLPNTILIDSYHPSRYNTNTGRLTPAMFDEIFVAVRKHVDQL